mmetsp:Transcript_27606/g.47004  ORF Transcript_27606/g.47004 Transcript_27606/m.47004 type:complete len:253 (-) Transcript_27606:893-1651(-)
MDSMFLPPSSVSKRSAVLWVTRVFHRTPFVSFLREWPRPPPIRLPLCAIPTWPCSAAASTSRHALICPRRSISLLSSRILRRSSLSSWRLINGMVLVTKAVLSVLRWFLRNMTKLALWPHVLGSDSPTKNGRRTPSVTVAAKRGTSSQIAPIASFLSVSVPAAASIIAASASVIVLVPALVLALVLLLLLFPVPRRSPRSRHSMPSSRPSLQATMRVPPMTRLQRTMRLLRATTMMILLQPLLPPVRMPISK